MKHPKRKQRMHDNWELYGEKQPHDSQLKLNGNDNEEKRMAAGLKSFLEDFSTVILIVYQGKIHDIINPVSQLLQKEDQNLFKASEMLQQSIARMECLRNSFEDVKEEAVKLAGVWRVSEEFKKRELAEFPIELMSWQ